MKVLNKSMLVVALLAFASPVFATGNHTCPYGGNHPNCKPKPEDPKPPTPTTPTQNQTQQQQQQQDQTANGGDGTGVGIGVGIGQGGAATGGNATGGNATGGTAVAGGGSVGDTTSLSGVVGSGNSTNDLSNTVRDSGNSASLSGAAAISGSQSGVRVGDTSLENDSTSLSGAASHSGGNTTESGSSSDNSGGNNDVSIDTSDRSSDSYESQALFIPSVQAAPPAIVASPALTVDRGVCGPRQGLITEDVNGIYIGMFTQRNVYLGKTDRIVSLDGQKFLYEDGNDGVKRLIGHRPVSYIAVIGVAGSRSIGLGGGKTGGDWGNAGASGGSSMQRMVVQTNLEDCEFAHTAPTPVNVPRIDDVPPG